MNQISAVLGAIDPGLGRLGGLPLFVFMLVALLTIIFGFGYLAKSIQVGRQFNELIGGLKKLRLSASAPPDREAVGLLFRWEPLTHLWDEYKDTLHEVVIASGGSGTLKEWRATTPAEAFFTRETLVEARFFDEFTRHLPGVLTGLGIIGTFAGLLGGLSGFDPSDPAKAVAGLKPLMEGVQHAFVASGMAIACAMIVVFASRLVLAYFYRQVEHLTQAIDSLYRTGAGEEYLARLVKSSEVNAAQTAQLKDALVEDLSKLMTNLVERQIAAQQSVTQILGDRIGESIAASIAEPMKKVGAAMEMTAQGNGEQVTAMLESLLTAFMAKIEDTFGGQIHGINEQMQKSMDAMTSVQTALQRLVEDIKSSNKDAADNMGAKLADTMQLSSENQARLTTQMSDFVNEFRVLMSEEQGKSRNAMQAAVGQVLGDVSKATGDQERARKDAAEAEAARNQQLSDKTAILLNGLTSQVDALITAVTETNKRAAESMGDRLEEAMRKSAENQNLLTDQMTAFVREFKALLAEEQGKSKQVLDETVHGVLSQLAKSVEALEGARIAAGKDESARGQQLGDRTNQLIGGLSDQVESLIQTVASQVEKTQKNIDALGVVSLEAIDGMNRGAVAMGSAAQRFETAGSSVTTVFDQSVRLSDQLTTTATTLQAAASAVQKGFEQYDATRNVVDSQVASLNGLIESARKEAGISKELVENMRGSVELLRSLETESREHLEKVNAALVKSFDEFGRALVAQTGKTIAETDRHLKQGTGHLMGVVQEFATAVQRMKKA